MNPALRILLLGGGPFTPQRLFRANEQGFFFVNDISTMYQDSAGTIPAALEQPLGLWLDSKSGGTRGPELATTSAVNGVAIGGPALTTYPVSAAQTVANSTYEVSFTVSGYAGTSTVGFSNFNAVRVSANGDYHFITTASNPTALSAFTRDTNTCNFSKISISELPGNHATQPTPGNRPTLKQDAKGNYYVHFNGTNQWMQTGSLDFTGTDKMTVFAGITKLSDAATASVLESSPDSAVNAGTFRLFAPGSAGSSNYRVGVRGAAALAEYSATAFTAPVSNVVSVGFNLAGAALADSVLPRVNGVVPALAVQTAGPSGGGSFGNYPVYVGGRSGSIFFNGDIYCLGARGASTTETQIAQAERYINGRMGGVY